MAKERKSEPGQTATENVATQEPEAPKKAVTGSIKVKNRRNQRRVLDFPRGRQVVFAPMGIEKLTSEEINSQYFKNRAIYFTVLGEVKRGK